VLPEPVEVPAAGGIFVDVLPQVVVPGVGHLVVLAVEGIVVPDQVAEAAVSVLEPFTSDREHHRGGDRTAGMTADLEEVCGEPGS
jgi:hypothetical protein